THTITGFIGNEWVNCINSTTNITFRYTSLCTLHNSSSHSWRHIPTLGNIVQSVKYPVTVSTFKVTLQQTVSNLTYWGIISDSTKEISIKTTGVILHRTSTNHTLSQGRYCLITLTILNHSEWVSPHF